MRTFHIILTIILLGTASSCSRQKIIPKQDLAEIYYDMYMTDEAISQDRQLRRMTDSLHLYEPIFNRYGYTTDDYLYSANHYLENPEKYKKIFEQTRTLLQKKKKELDDIYTYETRFDRLKRWHTLDSLESFIAMEGGGESFFKSIKFFFDQIDPKPVNDTRKFSLEVDRPDLDSLKAKALIADSLARMEFTSDSIHADSLFRMMYYIDTAACDTLSCDSIIAAPVDSTIYLRFNTAYIFEIDTVSVSDTIRKETAAKEVRVYYSPIAEFILRDSAFMKNVKYNYAYNAGVKIPVINRETPAPSPKDKSGINAPPKNSEEYKKTIKMTPFQERQEKMKQEKSRRRPMTFIDSAKIYKQKQIEEAETKRKDKKPARKKPANSPNTTKTKNR